MTQCDKDFFLLNTVTKCELKSFGGKFILRKYLNNCLLFENKFENKGKISLEYLHNSVLDYGKPWRIFFIMGFQ